MRQLGEAIFKSPIRGRRLLKELLAGFRKTQRQATPVVGVGASVHLARPDQHIDGPADGRLPAMHLCGNLLECCRRMHPYCFQEIALLTKRSRGNGIAAKLLDKSGEPFSQTYGG